MASIFPKEAETRSSDEGDAGGREHSSVDARGEGVVIICRVCTGPVGGTQEDEGLRARVMFLLLSRTIAILLYTQVHKLRAVTVSFVFCCPHSPCLEIVFVQNFTFKNIHLSFPSRSSLWWKLSPSVGWLLSQPQQKRLYLQSLPFLTQSLCCQNKPRKDSFRQSGHLHAHPICPILEGL